MIVRKVTPGEIVFLQPRGMPVMVVMVGDDGFRYFNPAIPEFDTKGSVITTYISYDELSEWTTSLGTVSSISESLMGKFSH